MFPRVIGQWVGRLAGYTCTGFRQIRQAAEEFLTEPRAQVYRDAAVDLALIGLMPAPIRPMATLYRLWRGLQNRSPENRSNLNVSRSNPGMERGLACYVNAARESDPFLISPFGTMPFERCLNR